VTALKKRLLMLVSAGLLFAVSLLAAASSRSPEEVVQQDLQALSRGDIEAAVALFGEDAKMFKAPADPHKLVGELIPAMSGRAAMRTTMSASDGAPDRYEIIEAISIGQLVVAQQKITAAPDYAKARYSLVAYRVQDGLIRDLWHVARADDASALHNDPALDTIKQFKAAGNRRDVEALLALFATDAKHHRRAEVSYQLSDALSPKVVDQRSRDRAYREVFSKPTQQVALIKALVFGDLVVCHEAVTPPGGQPETHLNIYRIRDGLIVDAWPVVAGVR